MTWPFYSPQNPMFTRYVPGLPVVRSNTMPTAPSTPGANLPDPMWRGWVPGTNAQVPGGASALPGPNAIVPSSGNLPAPAGQSLIKSLFRGGLKYGLGGIGQAAALLMGQPNNPDVVSQIQANASAAGRPDPFAVATPMSQSNLGQAVGAPQPLPQIPDLGTTPAYGSTPMPTAQSMPLPQGAAAAPGGGVPMPRPRPQVPSAPWVNPDAGNNFYNGPGSSTFGAGDPSQMAGGPVGQNYNIGALSRFFGS